jgi:phage shock protein PspC (stress-responsive transcriptional regulator)/predicted membrane protein
MTDQQPPGSAGPDPAEGSDANTVQDAPPRRTLCRSSSDKVVAGVAGGIGAYFGIDSVIVRIAFIVLTFLGGAGPFLYLIGWLALPKEDARSVIAKALGGDSPHRFRSLMAVALICLGLLITANLSSGLFSLFVNAWSIAPYLALILIAAGVALVVWPGSVGQRKPTPVRPPATAPPPGPPPPSSAYATPAPPPPTAAGPEWPTTAPHGTRPAVAAPVPPAKRRERSVFGWLTVAVLLVYVGAAVMLERLDVFAMDIGVFLAVAVAITGAGLLASALARPARRLILLGAALCVPLFLFVSADLPRGSGVGEARVRVTAVEELKDEYRHGIGQLVVDLRGLDPERTDHSVDLRLGIGELRVYVPVDIATTADVDVGVGNIRIGGSGYTSYTWSGSEEGVGISSTVKVPVQQDDTTGELRLDIDVGIGAARVIFVPAPIEGSTDS